MMLADPLALDGDCLGHLETLEGDYWVPQLFLSTEN
jgi:hypothetical protein